MNRLNADIRVFKRYIPLMYYVLLSAAIFIPLLKPGYILTLDTTWAPHRNYLVEYILGNGIGGQGPFLFILECMDIILPSQITQKIVLFSVFLISGIAAHVSVPSRSDCGKYFGGTLYAVNPFIYTRFLAGHFYLLLAYAFVPLAVRSFSDFLEDKRKWKQTVLWMTVISIFDMHVLLTVLLIQLCIFLFRIINAEKERKESIQNTVRLGLVYVLINMFWIIPVFLSLTGGTSVLSQISTPDLSTFTARPSLSGNILISLAMMYGFWREGYIYPFHLAPAWIFVVLFTLLLFFAVYGFMSSRDKNMYKGLALSAIISLVLASGVTYTYFTPVFKFLFENFFIFRGMRDSHKFVGVLVLVYSFLGSRGVDELYCSFKNHEKIKLIPENRQKLYSVLTAAIIIATPLLYSFTIFDGFHGQIEPKDYPPEWYEVNAFLNNDTGDFDVLFFPWHMYMSFSWSDRRIANPANLFFDKNTIIGENAEVGSIQTQSSKPSQAYVGYLLEHKNEINHLGELVTPLNVRYVVLAKEVDYRLYDFLYDQDDLEMVMENEQLVVFRNMHPTSRIREVTSLRPINGWADLVALSNTTDINDCGYYIGNTEINTFKADVNDKAAEKLTYTRESPFRYHIRNASEYVLFTSPDHDQNGWVLDERKNMDSAGLYSIFEGAKQGQEEGNISYKPFMAHVIGVIMSSVSMLVFLYPKNIFK